MAEPELIPTAIEEMLRLYAPATMARIVTDEVEVGGRHLCPGERVLLPFPAANRDPDVFEHPDEAVIDRTVNRHATFGLGIHRCLGSNLARMELQVGMEEWLAAFPSFRLDRRPRPSGPAARCGCPAPCPSSSTAEPRALPGQPSGQPRRGWRGMVLDEDMQRVVGQQRLGYVASVCPDGTPNLSPKGTVAVWDDEHLVFAHIHSPGPSPTSKPGTPSSR